MKTVRDLISGHDLIVVSKKQTVLEVARLMAEKNIGAVPVLDDGRLVGIFSERDIMTRVVARELNPAKTLVEQVMTRDLIMAGPEESVDAVETRMKQRSIRHLPIVSENKLVGILSLRDLLEANVHEKDEELRIMTAYIHYIPPTYES